QIFFEIKKVSSKEIKFLVKLSYLEIYNDVVTDLLRPDRTNLKIKEQEGNIFVANLSEWIARTADEMRKILKAGKRNRKTRDTALNKNSSRSHTLIKITIERCTASFRNSEGNPLTEAEFRLLISSLSATERKSSKIKDLVSYNYRK